MFSIVEFKASDSRPAETAIVPSIWIIGDGNCYWPPYRDTTSAVKSKQTPFDNHGKVKSKWQLFPARIVKQFESYNAARKKLQLSLCTSDLSDKDNCVPVTRKRKRNKKYYPSSSSSDGEEIEVPTPPTPSDYFPSLMLVDHNFQEVEDPIPLPPTQVRVEVLTSSPRLPETSNWNLNALAKYMVENFAIIKERQSQIDAKLEILLARGGREGTRYDLPENPLRKALTMEDIEEMEIQLNDEPFKKSAVLALTRFGGNSCYDTVSRIMKAIMDEKVMKLFSLFGRKGKRCFHKSPLYQAVIEASLMNKNLVLTEAELQKSISSVLRHA